MEDNTRELIERMERQRGFDRPWRRILAEQDLEFMEGFHKLNMHALYREDGLPHKYVELIQIATNAVKGYEPGFRVHLRNALREGVTQNEVIQVLEICALGGIHYAANMLPAFEEVVKEFKEGNDEKKQL